jgi:YgiT-type zinc finger domain-containing protein
MKCPVCRIGETRPEARTVPMESASRSIVLQNVPAQVCQSCGEAFVDEERARRVLESAAKSAKSR